MTKGNEIDPDLREALLDDMLDALRRAGITSIGPCVALVPSPDGGFRVATLAEIEKLMREHRLH